LPDPESWKVKIVSSYEGLPELIEQLGLHDVLSSQVSPCGDLFYCIRPIGVFRSVRVFHLSDCDYNGTIYSHGATYQSTDGCNNCSCDVGITTCTNNTCTGKNSSYIHVL